MSYREFEIRLQLFKNVQFLFFILSGVFATFGYGLIYISLSWSVYQYHSKINSLTTLMLCLWLPSIIGSPFFGYCADRFNRKHLIILSNSVRGFVVVIFVLLSLNTTLQLNLYYLAVILGFFVSFYMPAALPLMQEIVSKPQLLEANATADMIYELGVILGMGISGFIITNYGWNITLLVGGIFFIFASIFNLMMKYKPLINHTTMSFSLKRICLDYFTAIKYLTVNKNLISIYIIQTLLMTLLMILPVILLPFVVNILNASSHEFSILESALSGGVITGSLISPIITKKTSFKLTIIMLLGLISLALVFFSLSTVVKLSYLIYFAVGFGLSSWAVIITYGQIVIPNSLQGRIQAFFYSSAGIVVIIVYLGLDYISTQLSIYNLYLLAGLVSMLTIPLALTSIKE